MASTFRFKFVPGVSLAEAADTARLSLLAAEGLFGEARVRTESYLDLDQDQAEIRVIGDDPVGPTVSKIFTALISREFGSAAFTVHRDLSGQVAPAA